MNTKKLQLAALTLALLQTIALGQVSFNDKLSQQLTTPAKSTPSTSTVTNYGIFVGSGTVLATNVTTTRTTDTNNIYATGFPVEAAQCNKNGQYTWTANLGAANGAAFTNALGGYIYSNQVSHLWQIKTTYHLPPGACQFCSETTLHAPNNVPAPQNHWWDCTVVSTGQTVWGTNTSSTTNIISYGSFIGDHAGATNMPGTGMQEDQLFFKGIEAQLLPYANFLLATNVQSVGYGPMNGMDHLVAGTVGAYRNFYNGDSVMTVPGGLKHFPATNLLAFANLYYAEATNGSGAKVMNDFFNSTGFGNKSFVTASNLGTFQLDYVVQPAFNLYLRTKSPLVWTDFNWALSNLISAFNVHVTSKHLVFATSALGVEGGNLFANDVSAYFTMGRYLGLKKVYQMAACAGDTNATAWIGNELYLISTNLQFTLMDHTAGVLKSGTNHANHDLLASAMAASSGALYPSNAIAVSSNLALQQGTGLYYIPQAQFQFPTNEVFPPLTNFSGFGNYWSTKVEEFGAAIALTDKGKSRAFWQDKATVDAAVGSFDNASFSGGLGTNYSWTFLKYWGYVLDQAGDSPAPEPFPGQVLPGGMSALYSASVYNPSNLYFFGLGKVTASDSTTTVDLSALNIEWYTNTVKHSYTNPVDPTIAVYNEPDGNGAIGAAGFVMTNGVFNNPENGGGWIINAAGANDSTSIAYVAPIPPDDVAGNAWYDGAGSSRVGFTLFGTNTSSQLTGLVFPSGTVLSGNYAAGLDPRANWPTQAATTNQVALVASNTSLYSLHTAINSTAWAQTNKVSGP